MNNQRRREIGAIIESIELVIEKVECSKELVDNTERLDKVLDYLKSAKADLICASS